MGLLIALDEHLREPPLKSKQAPPVGPRLAKILKRHGNRLERVWGGEANKLVAPCRQNMQINPHRRDWGWGVEKKETKFFMESKFLKHQSKI